MVGDVPQVREATALAGRVVGADEEDAVPLQMHIRPVRAQIIHHEEVKVICGSVQISAGL